MNQYNYTCSKCNSQIKTVPAGTSKRTGQPYNAFQACSNRDCDEKPPQTAQTPQTSPKANTEAMRLLREIHQVIVLNYQPKVQEEDLPKENEF